MAAAKESLILPSTEAISAAEKILKTEKQSDIENGAQYMAGFIHVPMGTPYRVRLVKAAGLFLAALALLDEKSAPQAPTDDSYDAEATNG